ncbi:major facilitator superfamily domain-containing protein [Xylariales sp. PMI_506]|nr:major facilitator superfamily domain-containing protein [Xylariales sp. PMI_506]
MGAKSSTVKATDPALEPALPRDAENGPLLASAEPAGAAATTSSYYGSIGRQPDYIVQFELPVDSRNPLDWHKARKWAVTNVLSASGFNRILVSTLMAPALSTIAADLEMTKAESAMALSIYMLASAFGPLVIGPLAEVYGREIVLHASNFWFLGWNIACGFATTKEVLITARFLAGFGASSIYALAGGVLGDIWRPHERGSSLGWYLTIPLIAVAVGPILGGFITANMSWRWMFWATSILQGVMMLICFVVFRETFAPLILHRIAARKRRETGDDRYQTLDERLGRHTSALKMLGKALTRPLRLLVFHPIIQAAALISAFNYGILYICLASYADLWITQYHMSIDISGLHYVACALGELLGSQIGGPLMDRLYKYMTRKSHDKTHVPEYRIPLIYPGAVVAAVGLVTYGWCAQYLLHWTVVDVGMVLSLFGLQLMGLPIQAYIMDVYPDHTSSALAATQFLRSMTAFLFPLFASTMYGSLGYGLGNSALAVGTLIIGIPAPFLIYLFGSKLRKSAEMSY